MGFSRTEATASYRGGEPHQWFNVQLIRRGDFTTVKVNGVLVFDQVYQPGARGEFGGVVTHWTDANFDDISFMELLPWSGCDRTLKQIATLVRGEFCLPHIRDYSAHLSLDCQVAVGHMPVELLEYLRRKRETILSVEGDQCIEIVVRRPM